MKKTFLLLVNFLFILVMFLHLAAPVLAVGDSEAYVKRSGTKFTLNDKEFKFVGFNLFDAASTPSYKCVWWERYSDNELDQAMKYMREQSGATVLRFWAFQPYTKSGDDWSGVDKVIRLAKKNGLKVIPVIENGPSHCTGDTTKQKWQWNGDTWYVDGYKQKYGTDKLTYREYVQKIVTKYKDEPAIFGWMMMNEADTSKRDAQGKSVLVNFAKDIGPLIKGIDQNHLLTVGTQSNGASGGSGTDFVDLYSLPEIDFTEAHDWPFWSKNEADPLPGSADGKTLPDVNSADCKATYEKSKVACSLANSVKVVGKPFVMGEGGATTNNSGGLTRRAEIMEGKIKATLDNGGAGYLVWHFNKVVDSYESFDVQMTTNDPIFAKMKKYAGYQFDLPGALPSSSPTTNPTVSPSVSPAVSSSPKVTPASDITGDGKVDLSDFTILSTYFLKSPAYGPADLNKDNVVNLLDFSLMVRCFGKITC